MHEKQLSDPTTNHHSESTMETDQPLVPTTQASEKIRTTSVQTLNDVFRQTFIGGRVMTTPGIQALEEELRLKIVQSVQSFKDFTKANDPHGEHDFGIIRLSGETVYWKIDYYDRDCVYGSEDSSDPEITTRVLTIYLASEH